MRVPKYKMWIPQIQEMHEVISIRWDACDSGKIQYACSHFNRRWWRLEQVILLEYVGLKDGNGKDIYEGDILSAYILQDCSGGGYLRKNFLVKYSEEEARFLLPPFIKSSEIIGSIHENPELLEVGE